MHSSHDHPSSLRGLVTRAAGSRSFTLEAERPPGGPTVDAQTGCPPWTWSRRCRAQPRRGVPPGAVYDDPAGGDWHRMRMPGPCPAAWRSGSGACLRILQEGACDAQRGLAPQVGWVWGARRPPVHGGTVVPAVFPERGT